MVSSKKYEALTGDWEELNKETYLCNVCLRNNLKVYFCKKIDVTLVLSIMAKEKSDGIAKSENLFGFLRL